MKATLKIAIVVASAAALVPRAPARVAALRLRGGEGGSDDDEEDVPLEASGKALTREEINERLNRVPTFTLVAGDGAFVPAPNAEWVLEIEVIFWTDPGEAEEALQQLAAAQPEKHFGLRLGVLPLGTAFAAAGGYFGEAPHVPPAGAERIVLRGPRAAAEAKGEEGRGQMRAMGLEAESVSWAVPVFMCDEFQTDSLYPILFSNCRPAGSALASPWKNARERRRTQ